ncbi:MAG: response regulator [Candidatus Delongbacteria bacterium]|nr:response regulator [Candidatus Delongbacteria bacterium]MBN2835488.1 response regulator [Candidatus Delongbacteria bacterium]
MIKKILFVDDETFLLKAIKRLFRNDPYELYFAKNGKEALEIIGQNPDIGVVVTDLRMPMMDGSDLLQILEAKKPNIIKIVSTGHYDVNQIKVIMSTCKIYRYLKKPWDADNDFVPTVKAAVKEYYGE